MVEEEFDVPACLVQVRRGDETASAQLVEHFYPLVIKIVRSHLPRRVQEEDLAQDIFLKMFTRMEQYQGKMPFSHWLSRIAVTTCLDALRSQKRRPELRWADLGEEEAEALRSSREIAPEADSSQAAAIQDLASKLLETLEPKDRIVVQMLDMEGRSIADVRERTGWGVSMIKVRAFRARRKLRKALERLESQETSP